MCRTSSAPSKPGADDFLGKPVEERLLIAKVKLLVTISRLRKR